MVRKDTYKGDALLVVDDADDPIPGKEVSARMKPSPTDISMTLKRLYDDDYVGREGEGVSGDPYRYTTTGKGEAAAKDLRTDEDEPENAGLSALGFGDDEKPSNAGVDTTARDDAAEALRRTDEVAEQIADAERYVDGVEERLSSVEDAVGSNNVALEDFKSRLEDVEDAVGGADHVVAFDDKEFVETVLMVAQSNYGGSAKKRHALSTLLGVEDAEQKGLLSRALSAATDSKADQSTEDDAYNHE